MAKRIPAFWILIVALLNTAVAEIDQSLLEANVTRLEFKLLKEQMKYLRKYPTKWVDFSYDYGGAVADGVAEYGWEGAPELLESQNKIVMWFSGTKGAFDTDSKISLMHDFQERVDEAIAEGTFRTWLMVGLIEMDDIFAVFFEQSIVLGCLHKGTYYVNEDVID